MNAYYIFQCANSSAQLPSTQTVMASNSNTHKYMYINNLYADDYCATKHKHYSSKHSLSTISKYSVSTRNKHSVTGGYKCLMTTRMKHGGKLEDNIF